MAKQNYRDIYGSDPSSQHWDTDFGELTHVAGRQFILSETKKPIGLLYKKNNKLYVHAFLVEGESSAYEVPSKDKAAIFFKDYNITNGYINLDGDHFNSFKIEHASPVTATAAASTKDGRPIANRGLKNYGGWNAQDRKKCTEKLKALFSNNLTSGTSQLEPTGTLPYHEDLETLQQSVKVHIWPGSCMTRDKVKTWLSQKQYREPQLIPDIKRNAMDVVLTGSMKQFYDYDENTPVKSRDLTKNPRDIEFMYNTMPNFQRSGAHYEQVFNASGHLKEGYEATMKVLFNRSFTTMLHACKAHYEQTTSNGFTSFEFPVQMPNAFFSGFDSLNEGRNLAKGIFADALHEFLNGNQLPSTCSGFTTIGFGNFSSKITNSKVHHSRANSLHYYDAAKKDGVQCLVPIMGDEDKRMMNGAFSDRAASAAEENISRQTLGQPAMLLCPNNNPHLNNAT